MHLAFQVSIEQMGVFDALLKNSGKLSKVVNSTAYLFKWKSIRGEGKGTALSLEDKKKAKRFWYKYVQSSCELDLEASAVRKVDGKERVAGRYRRLSPYKDEDGIWRVGVRLQEYAPFTEDKKPPVFLPKDHRFTLLVMEDVHKVKHQGVDETLSQFRLMGFWSPQAKRLARQVKNNCVICRYLDHHPMKQVMGTVPRERLVDPKAWGQIELDLFGPFTCRSDVNKRSTKKVWGVVIVDKNSGAIHCDVVQDYSSQEVVKMMRRFGALRGFPLVVHSDPGSQLENAAGNMESWFSAMQNQLENYATSSNFEWKISPADSPWRQGQTEVRIKMIKRLIKVSVGVTRLTPSELQTVLFEVANLSNDRPIGVSRSPEADGTYHVLTPNCLLLGRSQHCLPDDAELASHMTLGDRYELVQQVTSEFWKRWCIEVTPQSIIRQKWHETQRNLAKGDVVLVHDQGPLKGKYTLAVVKEVNLSRDGLVRSCTVQYRIPNPKDVVRRYTGGKEVTLKRSVQRLTLLLPVEEQSKTLLVRDGQVVEDNDV